MFEQALLAVCLALAAGPATPDALLSAADAALHPLRAGRMRIHAAVSERNGQTTETSLDVYVQGSDRVLCVFRDGKHEGRKILVVGDRVWLLVPGTVNPIPMSANQRLLGGASVADVARLSFSESFSGTLRPDVEQVGDEPCRVLDLKRASPRIPYASGTLWVGARDTLARKARLSLRSGKPAKEMRFSAYSHDDGRPVLRRMEIHHLLPSERGTVTTLEFVDYDRTALPPELFDPVRAREVP